MRIRERSALLLRRGCVKNGDCCPDACLECGAGSLEGETTPPFTCVAGAAGEDPFWATSQPVGKIGKDQGTFENCGTCIAEAVIAFANTNCSAVCNPCPTLPSTSIQASVCATVGGIDGTSAGWKRLVFSPARTFRSRVFSGATKGCAGIIPALLKFPDFLS